MCLPVSVVSSCIHSGVQFLGYENPTAEQFEAIYNFIQGRDVFVSLPTGSGKSLCYAALPLVFDNIRNYTQSHSSQSFIVCVSPLTALMLDQIKTFTSKGLQATCIKDTRDGYLTEETADGEFQLLFMSPEALLAKREVFTSTVFCDNLSGIVVDEAHLILKWYVVMISGY